MADAARDSNNITTLLGVSNADGTTPTKVYVDPATGRLLVNASVTVTGLPTAVTDGEAIDAADTGNLALGSDGSNYQVLKTDSNGELQIDVLSSALPSGAATSAKQDTQTTELTSIKTAVETIDNAISGSEMQVDIVAALPAGDNNIGNVDLASAIPAGTNNIGDVDIFSNTAKDGSGTRYQPLVDTDGHLQVDVLSGGGTQYTEGDIDASITGTAIMFEVDTNELGVVSTNNPMPVSIGDTLDINLTSSDIALDIQGQYIIDDALTDALYVPVAGRASTAAPSDVGADGDAQAFWLTRKGALNIADAGGSITVDNGGTFAVQVSSALPAGTNAIGKLAANSGVDIGDVDVTSIIPGTGATNLGKAEDAAHASGDTGVMALGVRTDTPNVARADTDLDYAPIALYRTGAVRTAIPEEDFAALGSNHVKKYYTNAGAVTDGIIWSPAAGKRWYVTDLIINVSAAATVTLEDDKAGGDEAVMKFELAANSGVTHSFNTPLFSGEDAADLLITTTAGNVYVTITGYEI